MTELTRVTAFLERLQAGSSGLKSRSNYIYRGSLMTCRNDTSVLCVLSPGSRLSAGAMVTVVYGKALFSSTEAMEVSAFRLLGREGGCCCFLFLADCLGTVIIAVDDKC